MMPSFKNKNDVSAVWYGDEAAAKLMNNGLVNTSVGIEGGAFVGCREQDVFDLQPDFRREDAEIKHIDRENGADVELYFKKRGVKLTEQFETFEGTSCIRQTNKLEKVEGDDVTLRFVSSARIQIAIDGELRWDNPDRFKIWYCRQGWATEGQWKHTTLRDLGMGPAKDGWTRTTARFRSTGSWSTAYLYPLLIVEDLEKNVAYFIESESGGTWEMQLGKMEEHIYIDCNSCNSEHDAWFLPFSNGDTFETRPAVYGRVEGGFEEAVKELTEYKRQTTLKHWKNNTPAVCFNDYMNGTTGDPRANIYDMITAAGEDGCEVFCIDAGWFRSIGGNEVLGDYNYCDSRFAPYTFGDIIDHIKEMGMIPGVWFEFEAVVNGAKLFGKEGCARTRNGEILCGDRAFYDLTNKEVREHLFGFVQAVYDKGVRYIKNDYNQNTGIGSDGNGVCLSVEGMRHITAFYDFINELYERFPDMIIENCCSGAMRSDTSTLKHFTLQSVSDQSYYTNYPSIVQGSLAQMAPEKAGIWGFTLPLYDKENYETFDFAKRVENMADGEELTFNMVSAMSGCMYLSGWLNKLDNANRQLVKEGIAVYKGYREVIGRAHAVFPTGFVALGEEAFATVGLMSESDRTLILSVWKIGAPCDSTTVDLSKYLPENAVAELIYPVSKGCDYSFADGKLSVTLSGNENMARLFKFTF